jgi:hypothetical protein
MGGRCRVRGVMAAISVRTPGFEAELGELEAVEQILLQGPPQGVAVANAGGAVKDEGIHSSFDGQYWRSEKVVESLV